MLCRCSINHNNDSCVQPSTCSLSSFGGCTTRPPPLSCSQATTPPTFSASTSTPPTPRGESFAQSLLEFSNLTISCRIFSGGNDWCVIARDVETDPKNGPSAVFLHNAPVYGIDASPEGPGKCSSVKGSFFVPHFASPNCNNLTFFGHARPKKTNHCKN